MINLVDPASAGLPALPSLGGNQQAFIQRMMPLAIEASRQTGIDPRIIVGQAALESAWGAKAPGNNFFGIKSHGVPGGQTFTTTEFVNGSPVKMKDSFRTYPDMGASVQGYADFINRNPRYGPLKAADGLDAQLTALQRSGYATDPRYSAKVGGIARQIGVPGGFQTAAQPATFGSLAGGPSPMTEAMPMAPPQAMPMPAPSAPPMPAPTMTAGTGGEAGGLGSMGGLAQMFAGLMGGGQTQAPPPPPNLLAMAPKPQPNLAPLAGLLMQQPDIPRGFLFG